MFLIENTWASLFGFNVCRITGMGESGCSQWQAPEG